MYHHTSKLITKSDIETIRIFLYPFNTYYDFAIDLFCLFAVIESYDICVVVMVEVGLVDLVETFIISKHE